MPCDMSEYPANWPDVRRAVLLRAGGKSDDPRVGAQCEWCGGGLILERLIHERNRICAVFVECAECSKKLAELKSKIEQAVMERGESAKIAGVMATYYKPSYETPDYQYAAKSAMPEGYDLAPYSTTTTVVRWKKFVKILRLRLQMGRRSLPVLS